MTSIFRAIWIMGFMAITLYPHSGLAKSSDELAFRAVTAYFETETKPREYFMEDRATVSRDYFGKAIDGKLLDIVHRDLSGDGSDDVVFLWKRASEPTRVYLSAIILEDVRAFNIEKRIIKNAVDARIVSTEHGILDLRVQSPSGAIRSEPHAVLILRGYNKIVPLDADQVATPGQRAAIASLTVNAPPGVRTADFTQASRIICRDFRDSLVQRAKTADQAGRQLVADIQNRTDFFRSAASKSRDFATLWNRYASFLYCGTDYELRLSAQPLEHRATGWNPAWAALQETVAEAGISAGDRSTRLRFNALDYVEGRLVTTLDVIDAMITKDEDYGIINDDLLDLQEIFVESGTGKTFDDLTPSDFDEPLR